MDRKINWENVGYKTAVVGTALILIWIGLFKFTEIEAKAIEPLVSNHFVMNILYSFLSVQGVSVFIGIMEIVTAIGLILSFWNNKAGIIAGWLTVLTFVTTLSFLFTTPDTWKSLEGFPITDFFILKDLPMLGVGLMVLGKSYSRLSTQEQ